MDDAVLLEVAQGGDADAFESLVLPYLGELRAHCYRMLGSVHDAEDCLQDALLGAWRGLPNFEGRSGLRTWLYSITTRACLRAIARRPPRVVPADALAPAPSASGAFEFGTSDTWVEPWIGEPPDASSAPEARYDERESVELAFIAAVQHLPGNQRATLILRDVLGFSAAECATLLETSTAAVNSALQRARRTTEDRLPASSQQVELRALGAGERQALVERFVAAWQRADIDEMVSMLADDAVFTMPPLLVWFDGIQSVTAFMRERLFETPWRVVPVAASGQLAFACYQQHAEHGPFQLSSLAVVTVRNAKIAAINGFVDPAVHGLLPVPAVYAGEFGE